MNFKVPGGPGFDLNSGVQGGHASAALEEEWQRAEQRALLYLKSLRVHPRKSLELALQSVERAEKCRGGKPVVDTMFALCSLLQEQEGVQCSLDSGLLADDRRVPDVQVAPPIHRGIMVPVPLDRQPWLTFLEKSVRQTMSRWAGFLNARKLHAPAAGLPAGGPARPTGGLGL